MAQIATIVTVLALAGAIASWIAAATFQLRASHPGAARSLAIVLWPFATRRLQDGAAEHASKVNKALVAFFACLTVAVAATSVATNLSRLSR